MDWSSVEVFAGGDRQAVITDQIFLMPSSDGLALFANGGNAKLVSLHIWQLRSIWGSQQRREDALRGWRGNRTPASIAKRRM